MFLAADRIDILPKKYRSFFGFLSWVRPCNQSVDMIKYFRIEMGVNCARFVMLAKELYYAYSYHCRSR